MKTDISTRLGVFLRNERERHGLSQASLATSLNKSQVWLSRVERGVHEPRLRDLDALLRELNLVFELRRSTVTRSEPDTDREDVSA